MRKAIEKKEKFLKGWLKNEMELASTNEVEGEKFTASITTSESTRISSDLVRRFIPEDDLHKVQQTSIIQTMRLKRRLS